MWRRHISQLISCHYCDLWDADRNTQVLAIILIRKKIGLIDPHVCACVRCGLSLKASVQTHFASSLQGNLARAYDMATAPRMARHDRPDKFARALLAGQLKHAEWQRASSPDHPPSPRTPSNPTQRLIWPTQTISIFFSVSSRITCTLQRKMLKVSCSAAASRLGLLCEMQNDDANAAQNDANTVFPTNAAFAACGEVVQALDGLEKMERDPIPHHNHPPGTIQTECCLCTFHGTMCRSRQRFRANLCGVSLRLAYLC